MLLCDWHFNFNYVIAFQSIIINSRIILSQSLEQVLTILVPIPETFSFATFVECLDINPHGQSSSNQTRGKKF